MVLGLSACLHVCVCFCVCVSLSFSLSGPRPAARSGDEVLSRRAPRSSNVLCERTCARTLARECTCAREHAWSAKKSTHEDVDPPWNTHDDVDPPWNYRSDDVVHHNLFECEFIGDLYL